MVRFKWTIRAVLLTPVLLVLAIYLMGGGHGFIEPAIFLFPTGLVSILIFDSIELPFIILAVLQYPVYGWMIDSSRNNRMSCYLIVAFHISLVIMIILLRSETWR